MIIIQYKKTCLFSPNHNSQLKTLNSQLKEMFSYFLNPNRLLLSALLLLLCSFFVIPISRFDTHIIFLLFSTFYFIAYFKVRKNGIEFYANKIRENRNLLIVIFTYCIVIILFDLYRIKTENENTTVLIRTALFTPLALITSFFFYKVFLKK